MILFPSILVTDDQENPLTTLMNSGVELPHGCGLDHATAEIEKAANSFKEAALELYKAVTEGREPNFFPLNKSE